MFTTTNSYAIAYFLPIILRDGMGFSVAKAQCLVAPLYFAAALVMVVQAYYGDKWHLCGPIIVFNAAIGKDFAPISLFTRVLTRFRCSRLGTSRLRQDDAVRYFGVFGVFLATIAANANCPALLTYQSNNIRGQWKRAFTSATLIGGGAIGGIIGTSVFRPKDAPGYKPGILACLLAQVLTIVVVAVLSLKFHLANKRVDAGESLSSTTLLSNTLFRW
jgi:hypothetical protein